MLNSSRNTTISKGAVAMAIVIKRDGRKVPFNIAVIERNIKSAAHPNVIKT